MEGLFTRLSWCLAFSLLWGHAQGQSDAAASVHGGFEHYFVGGAHHPNIHSSLDYVELGVDLSPTFQVQGSFAQMGSWAWVEEKVNIIILVTNSTLQQLATDEV